MTATQNCNTLARTTTWQGNPAHDHCEFARETFDDDFSELIWINSHSGQRQFPF